MKFPQAYIDYLLYFHIDRDFFECHEVLEEYWKSKEGAKEQIWVGLIQLAVALYHYRRKNFTGALKMISSSHKILSQESDKIKLLGIDRDQLFQDLITLKNNIEKNSPYHDYNIPLVDEQLLKICQDHCKQHNLLWGNPTDFSDHFLIHKHSLRDRKDVINERAKQKRIKNNNNTNS